MTHKEKVLYMEIACSIVGYKFEHKGIDMLVSLYDLVIDKKGETDLLSIARVKAQVEERSVKEMVESEKEKI